ncbi:ABC-type glutathione transport system ATPase component [Mesorhizobium sp. URHB0026]
MQIVFQNPDSALNRSHSIRHLIGRALKRLAGLRGAALEARLNDLLRSVRLTDRHLAAKPRQLSGGLKQRVAIARAFAGDPRIVVCDEPTSALDVSVQAAILNLLADLQAKEDVSYIFISHDLGVVRYLSDKIAVLYLGRILEIGPSEDVFPDRITPTPRRCYRPYPSSIRPRQRASGSMAKSPAPATRHLAASSTRAAHARSGRSANNRSRRSPRPSRGIRSVATFPMPS